MPTKKNREKLKWITRDEKILNLVDLDKQHLENIIKVMQKISVQKSLPMDKIRLGKNKEVSYLDIKWAIKSAKHPVPKEYSPEDFMDMIELE